MSRRGWWVIAAGLVLCAEAWAGGQRLELSWPTPASESPRGTNGGFRAARMR